MRVIGRLVAKPMLHIHARLRALEDDMTVHQRRYDAWEDLAKIRMFT